MMRLFKRSGEKSYEIPVTLRQARAERERAREQLEKAKARRGHVEETIRFQQEVREENGFGKILETIFSLKEE